MSTKARSNVGQWLACERGHELRVLPLGVSKSLALEVKVDGRVSTFTLLDGATAGALVDLIEHAIKRLVQEAPDAV